mmetsp:Transcript_31008/g.81419  ORF Transcript_31008/g.81419 Transcript_31008/m.81419 type:complete len:179 (-) Transcript_31008:361-897(-)
MPSLGYILKEVFTPLLYAVPIGLLAKYHLGTLAVIEGQSMSPTLNPSTKYRDVCFVLKAIPTSKMADVRGRVVCLNAPDDSITVVKRIIALPGDYVRHRAKNGNDGLIKVPAGHVWVEGDNYPVSRDSTQYGPVPIGLIEGHVTHVVWPPNRFRRMPIEVPEPRVLVPFVDVREMGGH